MSQAKKKVKLEQVREESNSDYSDEEDDLEAPKKVTVAERLRALSVRADLTALIGSYQESDDEDDKRGYVRKDDLNRKKEGAQQEDEDEEDLAAMRQRVRKKMRERRAKDIKRQKRKREKRREMKSGNLIVEERKEAIVSVPATTKVKEEAKETSARTAPKEKVFKTPAYKRKHYTVSIAVPGSILSKGDDLLRTRLCGEIARAATIFRVDEIVIYNETGTSVDMTNFLPNLRQQQQPKHVNEQEQDYDHDGSHYRSRYASSSGKKLAMDDNVYMANVLYFLETPPYLRSKLFPLTLECLRHAVNCPALGAPHHLLAREFPHRYRDGVILEEGNLVFVGHQKLCLIKTKLPPGLRVTVETYKEEKDLFLGRVVSSTDPKSKEGIYWGYNVRVASSLTDVLVQNPYEGGYDVVICSSESGRSVDDDDYELPYFKHLMIVFGSGDEGLAQCVANDKRIPFGTDVRDLFDQHIDCCPHQGSRYLRTEESVQITLATLRKRLDRNCPPVIPRVSKFSQVKLRTLT